ncbi:hypothetical protein [Solidesulfovibrio carbinolicus]|uniref:hypothetical protein n=1 Tax=Solidesulfovibrio carbinolicus TaxID=296842 RepID=UPI001F16E0CA|nr:hypothetical protein [Solidesulfovibrio carbinolicus]
MTTILHDPLSAASRNFLATLGVTIPEGDDVTVTIGSDTVRIVSGHDACVARCPAFPGYPLALVERDGVQDQLAFPTSWNEVAAWAANPPTNGSQTASRYSPADFMRLLTQEELDAVLLAEATDTDVRRMWAFIRAVGYVDMADPLTQNSLLMLRQKGYIATGERLQQIQDGVFQL